MLTEKSMAMVNTYSSSIKVPADNAFQLVRLLIESWAGGSITLGRGYKIACVIFWVIVDLKVRFGFLFFFLTILIKMRIISFPGI